MKQQRRSFTVEYKGSRAQRAAPSSIWGSADLSAIALQARRDAPELFEDEGKCDVVEEVVGIAEAVVDLTPAPTKVPTPQVLSDRLTEHNADGRLDQKDQVAPSVEEPLPIKVVKSKPQREKKQLVRSKEAMQTKASEPIFDLSEELVVLEQENAALRRQLMDRLRSENHRMTVWLARYDRNSL